MWKVLPVLAASLLGVGVARADIDNDQPDLTLSIASPENGAIIGDPGGMAFVSGKALALYGEFQTFDIVFVIDTSESTSAPSGADVDGDGHVGERRGGKYLGVFGKVLPLPLSDKGDSVLAAEVAAVRVLLEQLDPRTTRVGVVAFAGDQDPLSPDAWTVVPLTTEYARVRAGLKEILSDGPRGMTNIRTAVNLATVELMGTQTAYSERRLGSKRIMMFLTDGIPTLPIDSSKMQNARMAIQQAVRASRLNIRIDTFAIGEDALSEPVVVVEMARVSKGVFTPVRNPGDLRTIFEDVSFAEIQELRVRNRTNGQTADQLIQNADGTFSALLPMDVGENTLEVYARSTNATEARRQIRVTFLPDAKVQALSPRLVAQRNRLLENRLLDLQRRRLQIESERDDEVRRGLTRELEIEREKARERAEEQRKQLEIRVEEE
ncbi:MAG: vWA domain-containing protein [Myxococcota bacterium]